MLVVLDWTVNGLLKAAVTATARTAVFAVALVGHVLLAAVSAPEPDACLAARRIGAPVVGSGKLGIVDCRHCSGFDQVLLHWL